MFFKWRKSFRLATAKQTQTSWLEGSVQQPPQLHLHFIYIYIYIIYIVDFCNVKALLDLLEF